MDTDLDLDLDLDALTATIIHLIILPLGGGYIEIKTNFRQKKTYQWEVNLNLF